MKILTIILCFICLMTANLSAEKVMPGLQVGAQAPDFIALNDKGVEVMLSKELAGGPVVLVFYRGGWCYYCNIQLREFQSRLDDFNEYDATVVALSVDQVSKAAQAVEEKELGFTVLTNPEGDILDLYGLRYQLPEELVAKYKKEYKIDVEAASGQTHHNIAIPATYVINTDGVIAYAYANEDYKVRPSIDDIITALEELK